MRVVCGKCGAEMRSIDYTIAGTVYACSAHGSGFLAYWEIDKVIEETPAGIDAETVLTPYMARVG